MKTRMNQNSLEAFQTDFSPMQGKVFDCIKEIGCVTAKGVASGLKVPINHVTGRINELMAKNAIKIARNGKDIAGSKRTVCYYSVRNESDPLNIIAESWEEKYNKLEKWLKLNEPETFTKYEILELHEL